MRRFGISLAATLAVSIILTGFSGVPILAAETYETQTSQETVETVLTEETTEVNATSESTVPTSAETTTETSVEVNTEATTEPSATFPAAEAAEIRENGMLLDEFSVDAVTSHRIYSANDLVAALGPQNASATSSTDVKLLNNVLLKDGYHHYFDFLEGSIRIDFNGFRVEGLVVFIVNGGDIVFLDSSPAKTGGITSTPIIDGTSASGFSAIFQRGGNVTIQSGTYASEFSALRGQGGRLSISGGEFIGTKSSEYSASTGLEFTDGIDVTIHGGYFHGEESGLYISKAASSEIPLRIVITGGLFSSTRTGTYCAGIVCTFLGSGVAPDILGMIGEKSVLSPADIHTAANASWAYAQTVQTVYVARTSDGTLIKGGVESFVTRLYEQALRRGADPIGFANWVTQLKSYNSSGAQVAYGFFFSQELINQGLSDRDYLTLLYRVFFDRAPDEGGLSYWLTYLNGGVSRKFVFSGFANSQEWKALCGRYGIEPGSYASDEPRDQNLQVTGFVQRLYSLCLNRTADPTGMNNWTGALLGKTQDGAHVAYGFFFSQEMANRKLSNDAFVEVLYQVLLGRSPDAAGKSNWVSQLNSGTSRLSVFNGFVLSQEFDAICRSYGITRGSI